MPYLIDDFGVYTLLGAGLFLGSAIGALLIPKKMRGVVMRRLGWRIALARVHTKVGEVLEKLVSESAAEFTIGHKNFTAPTGKPDNIERYGTLPIYDLKETDASGQTAWVKLDSPLKKDTDPDMISAIQAQVRASLIAGFFNKNVRNIVILAAVVLLIAGGSLILSYFAWQSSNGTNELIKLYLNVTKSG